MAQIFEKKDRHVLPNWRSFKNTAKLGELNGSKSIQFDSTFKPDISDLVEDWDNAKNIGVASDLIGVALTCNQTSNDTIREVSKFVLNNANIAPKALVAAALNVLEPRKKEITLTLDISTTDAFEKSNLFIIHNKIHLLKDELKKNPLNSINWIEIGRLYTIIGQDKKAERAIKNALYISPENRFVLRNMARFFAHQGDVEFAHDFIKKSNLVKHDPWLLATEISLASLRDRDSRFTKSGIQIIETNLFHPFNITELASSLATLEMKNSSLKKSKKLFEKSLLSPNDNSLAQAEWASQEERNLLPINSEKFNLVNSFEALARHAHEQKNWREAIEYSKQWFLDLPFSKGSILFGNEIAFRKLKDQTLAVEVAKLGLVAHPNDLNLLNNIIYSLSLDNN